MGVERVNVDFVRKEHVFYLVDGTYFVQALPPEYEFVAAKIVQKFDQKRLSKKYQICFKTGSKTDCHIFRRTCKNPIDAMRLLFQFRIHRQRQQRLEPIW